MNKKQLYFPKRLPEPKLMGKIELDVFEKISKDSYKRWMIPFVDDALNKSNLIEGTILDIGCGPGLLSKEFAARSSKFFIIGIDISLYAIKQARKNCRGLKNVKFRIENVNHLSFLDKSFDLVICKDSLHHFLNPLHAIQEMSRVVKPGGIIYIQDLRRDVPLYLLKRVIPPDTVFKKLLYYSTRAAYTKNEFQKFVIQIKNCNTIIKTRKITKVLQKKYNKIGIKLQALREAFQSRYVAIIKKT